MAALLSVINLSFQYASAPTLVDVTLDLPRHALSALLGPNGSGKTTLLRLLAGILSPVRGTVEWDGANLRLWSRRELAKRIALVPQDLNVPFGLTVREMVMLGRTPHLRPFSGPNTRDEQVAARALRMTETSMLAERPITDLSGGEKQRVVIAMALAQEPQVLLLDEPTVHLDIAHQIEILALLQRLNHERGLTVLATMHDLNLASLYFKELALLKQGRIVAVGPPAKVLNTEQIRQVFDAQVQIQPHPTRAGAPQIVLLPE